jgi:hypothetical protein
LFIFPVEIVIAVKDKIHGKVEILGAALLLVYVLTEMKE